MVPAGVSTVFVNWLPALSAMNFCSLRFLKGLYIHEGVKCISMLSPSLTGKSTWWYVGLQLGKYVLTYCSILSVPPSSHMSTSPEVRMAGSGYSCAMPCPLSMQLRKPNRSKFLETATLLLLSVALLALIFSQILCHASSSRLGGRCSCGRRSMPANAMPARVCLAAMLNNSSHSSLSGVHGNLLLLPMPHLMSAKNSSIIWLLPLLLAALLSACMVGV